MSLSEYHVVLTKHCLSPHTQPCSNCSGMLQVAMLILKEHFCLLHKAFTIISSTVKYSSEQAISKLLKIPLVSITIGMPSSGKSFTLLLEMFPGTDYVKMSCVLNQITHFSVNKSGAGLERSSLQKLLNIAQSPRERECLKYAVLVCLQLRLVSSTVSRR